MKSLESANGRAGCAASIAGARVAVLALPLMCLVACGNTTIAGGTGATGADIGYWAAAWNTLPTERHGTVPGTAAIALAQAYKPASDRSYAALGALPDAGPRDHIVLYVNARTLPPDEELCNHPELFVSGAQQGRYAKITAALCHDDKVVDQVHGTALATDQSKAGLQRSFGAVSGELFEALQPGWNDPGRDDN